jgi:predicted nucleic acid-binding protein
MKFMSVRSFFDTNVLVYADDDDTPTKRNRAHDLYALHRRDKTGVASVQVLQEYFVTVTRKLHLDPLRARRKVELIAEFDIGVPEVTDILAAIDVQRLHGFSFWDCLIIRMAQQTGCKIIYSEDMQHAQTVGGIKIVNPFV